MKKVLAGIGLFFMGVIFFGLNAVSCSEMGHTTHNELPISHYMNTFFLGGFGAMLTLIGVGLFMWWFISLTKIITKP